MSDVLDGVLETVKIRTTLFAMAQLHGTWGVTFPDRGQAYFHAVTGAPCWLRVPGQDDLALGDGEVVLLARGSAHEVVSARGGRGLVAFDAATWRPNAVIRAAPDTREVPEPMTTLVCGAVDAPGPAAHPLLELLDPVVIFASGDAARYDMAATLSLLQRETDNAAPGSTTVLARLGDVLLVQLLRAWMARQDSTHGGWLAALRDPGLSAALQAIHERPSTPWTVEALAARAQLSRSRFSERFTTEVGVPPHVYLTRWRMTCACRLLGDGQSVHEVARAVGYNSEPAFSRAFSRRFGYPPSRIRSPISSSRISSALKKTKR